MRGKVGEAATSSRVGVIAKWLLIIFATGVLAFDVWGADAPDVIVWSFLFLPWIVGPAALAALLVARAWSRVEAWLFLGAEVTVIASTIGLWTMLVLKPDGQNGLAMVSYPLFQFAALLAYNWSVIAIAPVFRRKWSARV